MTPDETNQQRRVAAILNRARHEVGIDLLTFVVARMWSALLEIAAVWYVAWSIRLRATRVVGLAARLERNLGD